MIDWAPGADSRPQTAAERRRLPASERRERILDAAVRLFAERGFHAASMDQIAAAAGISKAVVYDHFTSKRELYTVLLDTIRGDMDSLIAEAIAPLPEGDRVWTAIDVFFGYVERNRDACRLLFLEVQGTTEVAAIVQQLEDRVAVALSATLAADPEIFDGHPDRERQVRILAELLKSAIHGLASWWYRHPDVPRADLVARTVGLITPAIDAARA
ncbi:TetR/AcrR family transcriptional regulator [Conexibacter sp. JD483]|uniref:TetR/AcrR family transcriptional regulator n=1 Tax=unclassified Conexibacter TaxID=2627773 RepID=UPI0027197F8F|nr:MULTISPECIES: TetR/AcrR family transcriptional regulator [unclassified Conexibacter]MDO8186887.1 TetR/AcrR family transcriptional regulator [Conexibacter sp. CPCC 205706]MDO8200801.1 TetR/AcrR family transcriptional regulator [Conexibacter sp. CPCC 205762]MDR9369937.1 TetR/AcrR family transcriptional regulator [Conexibacter sp. JD483]